MPNSGGPFDVIFTDGTTEYTVSGISNGATTNVPYFTNTTFEVVSVTNGSSCPIYSNFDGTATVTISSNTTPVLDALPDVCESVNTINLPLIQDGINGTWSGTGVSGGNSFNPQSVGMGTYTLTFTPNSGQCADPNTTNITVTVASSVNLDPLPNPCVTETTVNLPLFQGGFNGTWSGPGVTSPGAFNPSSVGAGSFTLTFTPDPGQCASANTGQITVNPAPQVNLDPIANICVSAASINLPLSQGGFTGTWTGT
ncbi:MAG: hypothetical protein KDD63_29795, partial [Bacteroidetes bacterium]|nr:hypothetical protein [Bacteroidota bacterium]